MNRMTNKEFNALLNTIKNNRETLINIVPALRKARQRVDYGKYVYLTVADRDALQNAREALADVGLSVRVSSWGRSNNSAHMDVTVAAVSGQGPHCPTTHADFASVRIQKIINAITA
jgi:hypothetical protein